MNDNQLRITLNAILGQHGLDLPALTTNVNNALNAFQNAIPQPQNPGPQELSLVKVSDFSGKADEDPHEWTDHFIQAAAANQWQTDARLIAIAMGYLKGAALDWARAKTDAGAQNRITHFNDPNQPNVSFVPRLIEKFAPVTKQNKWYYELMTMRQMATESVDDYSLRF